MVRRAAPGPGAVHGGWPRGSCRRRSRGVPRGGTRRRCWGSRRRSGTGGRDEAGGGRTSRPPARSRSPAGPAGAAVLPARRRGRYAPCARSHPEVSMDDPVLTRRSIRKYTDQPVDDATVERLLRAGMAAPSAGNQQPWQFIVIRDRATLTQITEWHPYARMLPSASVAVLVLRRPRRRQVGGACGPRTAPPASRTCSSRRNCSAWGVWLGVHPLPERESALRELLGIPEQRRALRHRPVRLAGGAQAAVRPLRRGARPPRALVGGGRSPGSAASLSPPSTADRQFVAPLAGVLLASDPCAAGAALRPGAGETGPAPRVSTTTQTERRGEP